MTVMVFFSELRSGGWEKALVNTTVPLNFYVEFITLMQCDLWLLFVVVWKKMLFLFRFSYMCYLFQSLLSQGGRKWCLYSGM